MVKSKLRHYSDKILDGFVYKYSIDGNNDVSKKADHVGNGGRKHLDWKELIGFVGGFLTTMGMVPQVWRLFKLKSAHEISLTFSLCLNIGIVFWLVYGILNGLMSIIIWNCIALALGCGMFYAKMKWGR